MASPDPIPALKSQIWLAASQDIQRVNRAIAASQPRSETVEWWQRVLLHVQVTPVRSVKKRHEPVPREIIQRYQQAHQDYQAKEYPASTKDFGGLATVVPDTRTSGGLTRFITNYLKFVGLYGNRINTTGRKIFDKKKGKEVWITGTTKKGTGDIVACINSKMVFFEVKIGRDTPSEFQVGQQASVKASGGEYFFVRTAEDFFECFDGINISLQPTQAALL